MTEMGATEPSVNGAEESDNNKMRKASISKASQNSQTASDFIDSQLQLEADAREALPYAFDHCTQPLGPLRQNLFSCLTCNPPPDSLSDPFTPAAVCYSCSIACHGEHNLVELFHRRNFTCDCGTTRLPSSSPCTLRINPATGIKGPVHSQIPAEGNTYNQNCRNRFCGCGEVYNDEEEKGIMFQCLGLASEVDGGCGEDWWHPECVVGLGRGWASERAQAKKETKREGGGTDEDADAGTEDVLPPGFPREDEFDTFICYKCVNANPWIKRYAGTTGFLPPVYQSKTDNSVNATSEREDDAQRRLCMFEAAKAKEAANSAELERPPDSETKDITETPPKEDLSPQATTNDAASCKKRKAEDAGLDSPDTLSSKKKGSVPRYHDFLAEPPPGTLSLFCKEDFRERFCRCLNCYPVLKNHPQLLEEEEYYEPPVSESGDEGGQSVGTGSLLDRGEAALSNMDRVRAIEGVMAYNHVKDKVKSFLAPFAESGQAVGAEDIKAYFEKLRGDEQWIRAAAFSGRGEGGDGDGDNRREQHGY